MTIEEEEALFQVFITECDENLSQIQWGLIALEARPDDDEVLKAIFRGAHTLKGNAASLGYVAVAELAHVVEELLQRLRDRRVPVTEGIITLLLRSTDALRELVATTRGWSAGGPGAVVGARGVQEHESAQARTLRVDVAKLDHMVNLIGEMTIARGQMGTLLKGVLAASAEAISDAQKRTDRLHLELQELVLAARMVPVEPAFRHFVRVTRDAAKANGKVARLTIDAGDLTVDTRVVELLRDPLTHMIRNAIGHGIEPSDARSAAGKDPCGQLLLRAARDGATIVVSLSDDGAGIDPERVRKKALQLGLVLEDTPMSADEVLRLISHPGFSTAEEVTGLSGRGLGMDVVQRNVEALRGSVEVASSPGAGTTVTIRLPLTLAIIDGFAASVGRETVIFPMESVQGYAEAPRSQGADGLVSVRGEALPFLRLRDFFAMTDPAPERESMVVVHHAGKRAGIVVDELLGAEQVVVKPLGKLLGSIKGVSGSTITGTGSVALILDVPALLRRVRDLEARAPREDAVE